MTSSLRRCVTIATIACLSACASPPTTAPSAVASAERASVITPERAARAVTIGRSTKAEVLGALGETLVISFDSGYEVWIYHLSGDRRAAQRRWLRPPAASSAEFVILFEPSGVVAKTRVRPAPGAS